MRRHPFGLTFAAVALTALGLVSSALGQSAPATQPAALHWYKGAIHAHSLWSDGRDFPEMVALHYRDKGFNFLCLTDHDTIADQEKWRTVEEITKRAKVDDVVDVYIKRWSTDWVETREQDGKRQVRLKKLAEFRPRVEKPGEFVLVTSEEITDKAEDLPVHLNAFNLHKTVKPQHGDTGHDAIQHDLAAVAAQEKELGGPIVVQINHPSYKWGVVAEDLADLRDAEILEFMNGAVGREVRGDELHAGDERVWDIANTLRLAEHGLRPLWGTASDDCHAYHGQPHKDSAHGWIMVRATALEPAALVTAMRAGAFYASTGVTLREVQYAPATHALTVAVEPEPNTEYTIEFIGTPSDYDRQSEAVVDADGKPVHASRRYSTDVGKVFASVQGPRAEYKLTGTELYVRARVTSDKPAVNPSYEGQMQQAWTQPVGWEQHVRATEQAQ